MKSDFNKYIKLIPANPVSVDKGLREGGRSCDNYHSYTFLKMCTKLYFISLWMYVATSLSSTYLRWHRWRPWRGSCDEYHSYAFLEMCMKSNFVSLWMYVATSPSSSHPCWHQQRPWKGGGRPKVVTTISPMHF